MTRSREEKDRQTRKRRRVDWILDSASWCAAPKGGSPLHLVYWSEAEAAANGPVGYMLWIDDQAVGVAKAKGLIAGSLDDLVQVERYAPGLEKGAFDFDGLMAPFICPTNGQEIRFDGCATRSAVPARSRSSRASRPLPGAHRQAREQPASRPIGPFTVVSVHPSLMPWDRRAARAQGV